jgi:WhiB family redox-sensing transcriptional regulator
MTVRMVTAAEMTGQEMAERGAATAQAAAHIQRTAIYDVADDSELGWQDKALCAEVDPEIFYPEKGGSTREAKMVCRSCEVRASCLEYALEHDERFGIFGGMSERERRRLKRQAA